MYFLRMQISRRSSLDMDGAFVVAQNFFQFSGILFKLLSTGWNYLHAQLILNDSEIQKEELTKRIC